jgi:hypothetical protein
VPHCAFYCHFLPPRSAAFELELGSVGVKIAETDLGHVCSVGCQESIDFDVVPPCPLAVASLRPVRYLEQRHRLVESATLLFTPQIKFQRGLVKVRQGITPLLCIMLVILWFRGHRALLLLLHLLLL